MGYTFTIDRRESWDYANRVDSPKLMTSKELDSTPISYPRKLKTNQNPSLNMLQFCKTILEDFRELKNEKIEKLKLLLPHQLIQTVYQVNY